MAGEQRPRITRDQAHENAARVLVQILATPAPAPTPQQKKAS
jgi:hypothetical protein